MKKKLSIKAEDILADEKFRESMLSEIAADSGETDKKEMQLASLIHSFLKPDQLFLADAEKEATKDRLKKSIKKIKGKKLMIRWSAAAAIFIMVSVSGVWYLAQDATSDIVNFAKNMGESTPTSDTRLILQGGQEVLINKTQSQISYTQNGKNISVDAEQEIVQEIASEKPTFNTVIVPYGKRTLVTLAEGTKVWLNSGSKFIYPAVFAEKRREVYIEGEAIFEVTPSDTQPFFVSTRDFEVKVLGTVFNVSSFPDEKYSSTVLAKGSIELSHKGNRILSNEKFSISPGTMATFDPDKNNFTQQKVNPMNHMAWRDGYIIIESERLSNILKKLARYYNVEILLQDAQIGNETFSGYLDLKNTPEEVLNVIAQTTPFKYKFENEKLILNLN
jgi:transmembrane sensor